MKNSDFMTGISESLQMKKETVRKIELSVPAFLFADVRVIGSTDRYVATRSY